MALSKTLDNNVYIHNPPSQKSNKWKSGLAFALAGIFAGAIAYLAMHCSTDPAVLGFPIKNISFLGLVPAICLILKKFISIKDKDVIMAALSILVCIVAIFIFKYVIDLGDIYHGDNYNAVPYSCLFGLGAFLGAGYIWHRMDPSGMIRQKKEVQPGSNPVPAGANGSSSTSSSSSSPSHESSSSCSSSSTSRESSSSSSSSSSASISSRPSHESSSSSSSSSSASISSRPSHESSSSSSSNPNSSESFSQSEPNETISRSCLGCPYC